MGEVPALFLYHLFPIHMPEFIIIITIMDYLIDKTLNDNGKFTYLVKWTGKTHFYNTWETKEEIKKRGFANLLRDYDEDQEAEKKPSKKIILKQRFNKLYKKRIIPLGKLKIPIRTVDEQVRAHWVFGNEVIEIMGRNHLTKKYKVKWNDQTESYEDESALIKNQPKKVCEFFESEFEKNPQKFQINL